jgi:hypothetical protein
MDAAMIWTEIAARATAEPARAPPTDVLRDGIIGFRDVPIANLHDWIATSIATCSASLTAELFGAFLEVYLAEFVGWLLEDRDGRLDPFIDFVAIALHSDRRLDFIATFSRYLPEVFAERDPFDVNFLLAIQSPIFAYACSRHQDSDAAYHIWFRPLFSSPEAVFRQHLHSALSYVKMMNHAFLQVSVTTSGTNQSDPFFVAAVEETRQAAAAIADTLTR